MLHHMTSLIACVWTVGALKPPLRPLSMGVQQVFVEVVLRRQAVSTHRTDKDSRTKSIPYGLELLPQNVLHVSWSIQGHEQRSHSRVEKVVFRSGKACRIHFSLPCHYDVPQSSLATSSELATWLHLAGGPYPLNKGAPDAP